MKFLPRFLLVIFGFTLLVSFIEALPSNREPRQVEVLKAINESLLVITGKIGTTFASIGKLESGNFEEVKGLIQADLEVILSGVIDVNAKLVVVLASPNLSPALRTALKSVQADIKAMADFLPAFIDKLKSSTSSSAVYTLLTKYSNDLTQGFLALIKCYLAISLDFQGMSEKIPPALELFDVLRPIIQGFMKKPNGLDRIYQGALILQAGPKLVELFNLLAPDVSSDISVLIKTRELMDLLESPIYPEM